MQSQNLQHIFFVLDLLDKPKVQTDPSVHTPHKVPIHG